MSPGFDPMGCIVEPIRYPYRTTMRFYTDSALETPVCWYFCSPEAKPLGCYTRFGSGLYGKDYMDRWEGTGETPFGPLDFRANCCKYPGKARIGTPEQFAEGVSILDAPEPVRGLVNCSNPPLTETPMMGPAWLDVATVMPADQTDVFGWGYYTDAGIGYILPNVLLTMTCENDPSLNGSWVLSWQIFPDNIWAYTSNPCSIIPACSAPQTPPQFAVSRRDYVGNTVDLTFAGSNTRICGGVTLTGNPRPVNYSGTILDANYGNVTATLTALPPTQPPPYPP